jgi:branched-chain amino acid aminotransferase
MATRDSGLAFIDGRIVPLDEARVPILDRGFLYADSVFETIRGYGRRPFLLGDHLDRLRRSAGRLFIPLPWEDEELEGIVASLIEESSLPELVLRITVTRGEGGSGLSFPEPQRPRLIVMCRALPDLPPGLQQDGVSVYLPEHSTAKTGRVPADVKSGSYLANVLALREARAKGGFDALLRGADGTWSEGTTANLFVVRDGRIHTPAISNDILAGITRALVLAVSREADLDVEEGPIGDGLLFGADEVFLTSSIKEVVPVVRLEGRSLGDGRPGPTTRCVQGLFRIGVERVLAAGATRLADVFP